MSSSSLPTRNAPSSIFRGWAKKNLPGEDRLKRYGLSFPRAFCNSCMCSPSRATLMTGYFPAQHGVKWTLEQNMPATKYPQQELPLRMLNLATVMASARYSTPYKGKFHLTKPRNPDGTWMLAYPTTAYENGYNPAWVQGDIRLPATVDEDLSTKPSVQQQFLALMNKGMGTLDKHQQRNYINFYGNLMKSSDNYLVRVLDTLEKQGLRENTLIIRTSDHGEMGLAHGGLRQKNFNFYEESLRVPLVYSNPRLYPKPVTSRAMVSHVDFLPTLASLFDVPPASRTTWQGVDYSHVVLDPKTKPPQKYIVFTYDDYQSGQANGPYPGPFNHIVSIREERYKLAKYYDANRSGGPYQWEMYDLESDPLETRNLADRSHKRTKKQEQEYLRLRKQLALVEQKRLRLCIASPKIFEITPTHSSRRYS